MRADAVLLACVLALGCADDGAWPSDSWCTEPPSTIWLTGVTACDGHYAAECRWCGAGQPVSLVGCMRDEGVDTCWYGRPGALVWEMVCGLPVAVWNVGPYQIEPRGVCVWPSGCHLSARDVYSECVRERPEVVLEL